MTSPIVFSQLTTDTHYVIAGIGPEHQAIKFAAVKSRTNNRVHILGRISAKQLKVLYNTVDAFIQPNISQPNDVEGFGLVLLEAALCNRPVFASRLEGMIDAIKNHRNGYLLAAQDESIWVTALTRQIEPISGQRAYTMNNFHWDAIIPEYIKALAPVPIK